MISMTAIIALFFGLLASLSAFLITLGEQKKNTTLSRKQRILNSLETAVYTFIILNILTFISLFCFQKI
jgi:hypothetical protein